MVAVSFIGGENPSTHRKPQIYCMSPTVSFIGGENQSTHRKLQIYTNRRYNAVSSTPHHLFESNSKLQCA